ncbi:peptide chain release factor N(5)-glutamine methyltransferase [Paenisporosarcina sp. TG20]|uniref:peptide chain release factor N(5)-glutamine methyltransferase n=1 Tax=Paenisporosarcina sp. TG20 TaxID=1211706 RepID=UPI00036789E4|nr:peptide chain release factor N(5)-glutamine methyltransferase [Paenisporosarcina sp. TG20]
MCKYVYEALSRASSYLRDNGREEPVARMLLQHVLNKTHLQLLMDMREEISREQFDLFWSLLEQHRAGKPVQYIMGTEEFYGRTFQVNKDVLIPRPETEELIVETISRMKRIFSSDAKLNLADIGTGSGVIAITMKVENPTLHVTATDLSAKALEVAKLNATEQGIQLAFLQGDLTEPIQDRKWDIVLSNPPYISHDEAPTLSDTVLNYEPHSALFADDEGLILYKRLALELPEIMNRPGLIGVEIGYAQGFAVQSFFQKSFPNSKVEIVKDINGKERMVFCEIVE